MGAVLTQLNEQGEEHPILYLSKEFSEVEKRYCTTEKHQWSLPLKERHSPQPGDDSSRNKSRFKPDSRKSRINKCCSELPGKRARYQAQSKATAQGGQPLSLRLRHVGGGGTDNGTHGLERGGSTLFTRREKQRTPRGLLFSRQTATGRQKVKAYT
ncbi:hypothetical protein TNCV_4429671 [Trichonephila clavipes]|nr:hypothetical protein TNCV_4429671 [Trichonephila clavipes]